MGSTDSSANETSDTEVEERQKINRRKTQKVEYKPDYETGKIFLSSVLLPACNQKFSDEKADNQNEARIPLSEPIKFSERIATPIAAV